MCTKGIVSAALVLAACGSKSFGGKPDASPFDAGPCPDQHGAYSISLSGQGCGNLSATGPECITQNACAITFTTSAGGLAGTAALGMDGSFTGAAINEGTSNRTGCTGTWDPGTSTLTVDCGGVGSSQSCIATLMRTASMCP
jgi:hypothetical protein